MEDWKVKSYLFQIIGTIGYVILIILAMLFYAGGTAENPNIQGYSFWGNTLSDSGRTIAYSGKINTTSMILFSIALSLWAISIIPFFIALRTLFNEGNLEKNLSTIGSLFAIIAAISLTGIAFSPADILLGPHMFFVYIAYTSLLIVGFTYSITLYRTDKLHKQYAIIFIIWTIIWLVTSLMGLVGLAGYRSLMVIGQKIGRFANVICFACVGYGAWKLGKTE